MAPPIMGQAPDPALRVALLSPCFWPEVRRGTERFARDLADGLIARGHRPRLITSHPGRPTRTVEDGLEVVRSWRPPDGRLRRRLLEHHLTHVPFSYRELVRGDDQVAHALNVTDALAAVRWSRRAGRPALLTYMGVPERAGLVARRGRLGMTIRAVDGVAAVVALSHTAAAALRRDLGRDARVIHPGVDVRAFRRSAERASHPTVFCAASAADPGKRVELLVRAFTRVRRERPGARLVLSDPGDPAVRRAVAGDADGVLWRDVDDRAELARAYSEAWVTVLASIGEAFGLVLLESLACGTPVVGSRSHAIPEVIDRPEIGSLFGGEDPEEDLAREILAGFERTEDPSTEPACRARAEELSTDRCTEAYLELYRELLYP